MRNLGWRCHTFEVGSNIVRNPWLATVSLLVALDVMATQDAFGQQAKGMKAKFDAVAKAQAELHKKFTDDLDRATSEEEQERIYSRYHSDVARNTGRVLEMVRENPADPNVVEALRFVIQTAGRGPGNESQQAIEILLRNHVRDPGMGEVCGRIFAFWFSPEAEALFRAVLERNPNRRDRGLACHTLSFTLGLRISLIRSVRQGEKKLENHVWEPFREATERLVKETDLEALEREREALLERVIAEFSDIKDWFNPKRSLGTLAEGERFAIRHLSEGKVAPEITGKDHEGKSFSLSDYRGKVIVLTFSTSWCGPCVAMYPQQRELVKRLEGRPFALVSVNADEDLGTLKKSIASGEITWRCWWDGGMDGPITTRWGVSAIPEIYVLDRAGVIRAKDVRGDRLEKAVTSLLDEAPVSLNQDARTAKPSSKAVSPVPGS